MYKLNKANMSNNGFSGYCMCTCHISKKIETRKQCHKFFLIESINYFRGKLKCIRHFLLFKFNLIVGVVGERVCVVWLVFFSSQKVCLVVCISP